jgi:hypothetical protein
LGLDGKKIGNIVAQFIIKTCAKLLCREEPTPLLFS